MASAESPPIVLAYDGSEGARAAIDQMASFVAPRTVLVVCTWSSLATVARAGLIAVPADIARQAADNLDQSARQRATELAEEGADRLRALGMEASPVAVRSEWNTWTTILDVAEEHEAALVVLGSRGLSGVKSAFLGSVSSAVLHHSSRPVLIVPPRETTVAPQG